MKKVTILVFLLLFLIGDFLQAQTTVTLGTGTTSNTGTGTLAYPTPYGTRYTNLRVEYMVLASELNTLGLTGPNYINAIGFNVQALNLCTTMPNYTIKVKNTAVSVLTTALDNGYYTEVWSNPSFLPVVGWNAHTFTTPFLWDGISNLLFDICFDTAPTFAENASVYYTATSSSLTAFFRSDDEFACGTASPATVSPNRANMQITYQTASGCLPPTLLPASELTPESAKISWIALNGESLWNLKYGPPGFNPETEGTMISGISANPYILTGLDQLTLYDVYVQSDCGNSILSIWSNPIIFRTITNPLSGEFTINSTLPTGGTNFNSFSDFALSLNLGGFGGPISLNVVPGTGPYNEQFTLLTPQNNNSSNTLIINGNGETIQYLATDINERATLKLNGTDYVTVNNLIIKALGSGPSEYGFAVHLMNLADYNTFNNCEFIAELGSVSINFAAFATSNNPQGASSTGLCVNYLTINNCVATGGYYGIIINGPSAAPFAMGNKVTNTQISDFYSYGLYLRGQNNGSFFGNTISRPTRSVLTTTYMIYLSQNMNNSVVSGNRIFDFAKNANIATNGYGIYGTVLSAALGSELLISNNLVSGFNGINGVNCGIYLSTSSGQGNVRIFHNTLAIDNVNHGGISTIYGIYHTGATARLDIRNNIISYTTNSTGNKYCFYFATNTAIVTSNYNVLHRGSTVGTNNTGYWSSVAYQTLANWNTANGGIYDLNSKDTDPLFTNILGGNLYPQNSAINNMGTNLLSYVPVDYAGIARTATPDPGALEFSPPDCVTPVSLSPTNISPNSALLSWQPGSGETVWNLEWGPSGFTPGTGTLVENLTSSSYQLTNLSTASFYDFYVQAKCSQSSVSNWVGPKTFQTLCETYYLPFEESFDGTLFPPVCWKRAYIAGTGNGLWDKMAIGVSPVCMPHSGAAMARFESYSFAAGTKGILATPAIFMQDNTISINFWMYRDANYPTNADLINVYYNTSQDLTGASLIGTVNRSTTLPPEVGATGWYEYTFVPPAGVMGQTGYFIFEGVSAFGYNIYIDDIAVKTVDMGRIEGFVFKSGTSIPIDGAQINFSTYSVNTNASGYYLVENVLPGTYNITASAEGYNPQTITNMVIIQGFTTVQDFNLTFANISIQPGEISVTLNPAETTTIPLTISNAGGTATLNWIATLVGPPTEKILIHSKGDVSFDASEEAIAKTNSSTDQCAEKVLMKGDLTDATWDIRSTWMTNTAGEQTIATDGQFIYSAKWNTNGSFSKYTLNGVWIEDFTIAGITGGIRDFAYDGTYFYGGAATTALYKLDFVNKVLAGTITSPVIVRHCTYDSHSDGFWVGDWNSLQLINRTGTSLITGPTLSSVYGSAYDPYSEGGPYLWFFAQVGTQGCGNAAYDLVTLQQFNIASLTFTGVIHCATDLPGYIPGNSTTQTIAGGLEGTDELVPGRFVLMANIQQSPNLVGIYEVFSTINWVSISPSNGTLEPDQSITMNVDLDATGYENVTLNSQLVITSNGFPVGKNEVSIPITLIVNPETLPPAQPTNPSPANNETMVSFQPVLTWTNGARTSEVKVTISKGLQSIYTSSFFKGNTLDLSLIPITLDPKTIYRWRIEARNLAGSTLGTQWQFTTIGQGTISGTITDAFTNAGIAGATITVDPNGTYTAETGANGTFSISGVLEGMHTVSATHPKYNSQAAVPATVVHNQTTTVNISLNKYLAPPTDFMATLNPDNSVLLQWKAPLEFESKQFENYSSIIEKNRSEIPMNSKVIKLQSIGNQSVNSVNPQENTGIKGVLYDNGPIISGACATTLAPESMVQAPTTSYGVNNNHTVGYSVADNFTIPTGNAWNIQSLEIFGYQTGAGTTSTFTGVYLRIWDGSPMAGGNVVWGDMTTNLMTSTNFTGIFRVSSTTSCAIDRAIMKIVASTPGLILAPGEYWVEYGTTGSSTSGPWIPPVYETGGSFTGNTGLQYTPANGWVLYASGGVNVEWPFILNGTLGGGTMPQNLLGFNIYKNNSLLGYVEKNTGTEYQYPDGPLTPGVYNYWISAVYNEGQSATTETQTIEIIAPHQTVILPEGWSGWSSYIDPMTDAAFIDIIAPVAVNMIFSQYFSSIYWPAYGINTMGAFSNAHGYVSKMSLESSLNVEGNLLAPGTINLASGWNLISVLSECDVDATSLGSVPGFIICMEVAGAGVYWPTGGITSLTTLVPGKAYWVRMNAAESFTYPVCAKDAGKSAQLPIRPAYATPWNTVLFTGTTHFIAVSAEAARSLETGDVLGVFNAEGVCSGMIRMNGNATTLNVFGDDATTTELDGMAEGSAMIFKVYRAATGEIFNVTVNYGVDMPDYNGTFTTLGMSRIVGMTLNATGAGSLNGAQISIFPNPSTGIFNITMNDVEGNVEMQVIDAHGQSVYIASISGTTRIDLTKQPKGVYYVKLIGSNFTSIEKVVIK